MYPSDYAFFDRICTPGRGIERDVPEAVVSRVVEVGWAIGETPPPRSFGRNYQRRHPLLWPA